MGALICSHVNSTLTCLRACAIMSVVYSLTSTRGGRHKCVCQECQSHLQDCPMCRGPKKDTLYVYGSASILLKRHHFAERERKGSLISQKTSPSSKAKAKARKAYAAQGAAAQVLAYGHAHTVALSLTHTQPHMLSRARTRARVLSVFLTDPHT